MRILAIDPGYMQSAFVVLGETGAVLGHGILPNADMCLRVRYDASYAFTNCVIEAVASYGMAVGKEVFETVWWAGRFAQAWTQFHSGEADRLYRRDVKLHLCGQVRAKDANIRAALLDLYGPGKEKAVGTKKTPGPLYGVRADEWAALAVGVTWLAQRKAVAA